MRRSERLVSASFLFLLCFVFLSVSITNSAHSENSELTPHVSFYLHFYQPDLETYKVQARMQSAIDCVRIDEVNIILSISNYHDKFGRYVLDFIHIKKQANWTVHGIEYFNYEDEHTVDFPIFGISEFYPFDSYFLNLTFSFEDDGQITNDTPVNTESRILLGQTTGWYVDKYSNVTILRSSDNPRWVYINQQIVLKRTGWSTFPIMVILQFGFLVLGSVVLVKAGDLRAKAAIYLAMFVFFSTFYFNVLANVPKRYSLSIGENMILLLISGTALSLIFSIIQYKFSQYLELFGRTASRQLIVLIFNQLMALAPVFWSALHLHTLFQSARGLFGLYFWINIPTELEFYYVISLMIFWIFGLVISVLVFYSEYTKKEENEKDVGKAETKPNISKEEGSSVKDQSKFEKLIQWIRSQITLRRAWYLYTISLILFVILSIVYPDTFRLTLGISVLTILMMYLIMVSGNIELQRATQTQVKAFVEQLQAVGTELKNVGSELSGLINVMRAVQRSVAESLSVSKTALELEEAERKRHRELIKPRLHLKVKVRGVNILWGLIDTRNYRLIVTNTGGDGIDTWVYVNEKRYGPYEIKANRQIDVGFGHVNDYEALQAVGVRIDIRDVDRNPYSLTTQIGLNQTEWIAIPLSER